MSPMILKSASEIAIMDQANRIVREILGELSPQIVPGMTTADIDAFAERRILESGGKPAFKDYPHPGGGEAFPGSVCTSVNSEIVHGVPSEHVTLREGDLVSVDIGVIFKGYFGDGAATFPVGEVDEASATLMRVTREALERGVDQVLPGNRISDIGHAVQSHVEAHGFSVVREFVGHGIGAQLHEEPQVPNFGPPGRREKLEPGLVLAIEPMVNVGGADVDLTAHDGWTARTRDGSRSAHFECCVAVTGDGAQVLGQTRQVATAAPV